jgi:hypothetical protein
VELDFSGDFILKMIRKKERLDGISLNWLR